MTEAALPQAPPSREEIIDRVEDTIGNVKKVQEELQALLDDLNAEAPL